MPNSKILTSAVIKKTNLKNSPSSINKELLLSEVKESLNELIVKLINNEHLHADIEYIQKLGDKINIELPPPAIEELIKLGGGGWFASQQRFTTQALNSLKLIKYWYGKKIKFLSNLQKCEYFILCLNKRNYLLAQYFSDLIDTNSEDFLNETSFEMLHSFVCMQMLSLLTKGTETMSLNCTKVIIDLFYKNIMIWSEEEVVSLINWALTISDSEAKRSEYILRYVINKNTLKYFKRLYVHLKSPSSKRSKKNSVNVNHLDLFNSIYEQHLLNNSIIESEKIIKIKNPQFSTDTQKENKKIYKI